MICGRGRLVCYHEEWGGGLVARTYTHLIYTHFSPLSPSYTGFQALPPPGHIMSRARDKEPGSGGGGGRLSDWPCRLQPEPSPVCLSLRVYLQRLPTRPFSQRALCVEGGWGGVEKREKRDAAQSYAGVCLQRPWCNPPRPHSHHHHHHRLSALLAHLHLLLHLSAETPGARLGVTAVSGMLRRQHSRFPGLRLHLRPSDNDNRSPQSQTD